MLSEFFPSGHPKAGKPTYFTDKIARAGVSLLDGTMHQQFSAPTYKYHTIRGNYNYWEKCFKEIYAGNACLSLRQWAGIPYRSKHIELARLTMEDGIGIQKLTFKDCFWHADRLCSPIIDGVPIDDYTQLAANDGLGAGDWMAWFLNYKLDSPMAIIQFTKYRYN